MRVLYFGTYERHYPRNAQVVSCLRRAGVDVVEHHVALWEATRHKFRLGARQAARLALAQIRLLRAPRFDFDLLVVGYPGHFDIARARRVARGRPVVFNPLVSLADTVVDDRQLVAARSMKASALDRIDRRAFQGADLVVADTDAHASFFAGRFGLQPERLAVCFVGADDALFTPGNGTREPFGALFVGKLIPLHGLETIIAAARLVPEIPFRIVGSGQLEGALHSVPTNVRWEPWIDYERLPDAYRSAGCALGVFGTSAKAGRVIPNKAFQALATSTPLVTGDTPGARELVTDGSDALLVPVGDAAALAAAVRRLAGDRHLAGEIGARGRQTYERRASEEILGQRWRRLLEELLERVERVG